MTNSRAEVSEFETLEDYKADIKEKIRDRKKEAANTERENKIVDAAVEAATMDIPEAMIEEQVQQMTDEFAQRLSYQGLYGTVFNVLWNGCTEIRR